MLWKKITIGILAFATLQIIDFVIYKYFNFSILNNSASWGVTLSPTFIIVLTLLALLGVVLVNFFLKLHWPFSLILIFSCGLSNLVERIFYGGVIDYINIKILPVFNIADLMITISAIILIYSLVFYKSHPNKTSNV